MPNFITELEDFQNLKEDFASWVYQKFMADYLRDMTWRSYISSLKIFEKRFRLPIDLFLFHFMNQICDLCPDIAAIVTSTAPMIILHRFLHHFHPPHSNILYRNATAFFKHGLQNRWFWHLISPILLEQVFNKQPLLVEENISKLLLCYDHKYGQTWISPRILEYI